MGNVDFDEISYPKKVLDNTRDITPKYLRNSGPINPKTLPQSNPLNHTNAPRTDLLSNFYYKIPANQSNNLDFQ